MSRPPYGYRQVRDGYAKHWEQEPKEAEAIRLAYRLSVEENKGYMAHASVILNKPLNAVNQARIRSIPVC